MRRRVVIASAVLTLFILVAGTALTQAPPTDPSATPATRAPASAAASIAKGQPAMNVDRDFGYYIWFDGDRIYVQTKDRDNAPRPSQYTGKIVVQGGTIGGINVILQGEDDSAVASSNTLDFRFTTATGTGNVDFAATGAKDITFVLYRDGLLVSIDHIFLGAGQVNPPDSPFTLQV